MTYEMSPILGHKRNFFFFLRENKQLISQLFEGIQLKTHIVVQGEDAIWMPVKAIKYTLNRIIRGNGNFFFLSEYSSSGLF